MTTIHLRREYLADRQSSDDLVILKLEHWEDLCEHSRMWKATALHLEQQVKQLECAYNELAPAHNKLVDRITSLEGKKPKAKHWRWF